MRRLRAGGGRPFRRHRSSGAWVGGRYRGNAEILCSLRVLRILSRLGHPANRYSIAPSARKIAAAELVTPLTKSLRLQIRLPP
jgi:hypothetical protein